MPQPAPSHFRRRWRNLLFAIAAPLLLLFVVAEIVLATDLPRHLVVSLLEKQLGLRLSAGSLSAGLFGHTTLNDVTVTLPLADKAFLEVPTLKLRHTWLPAIIFGSFNVYQITIEHPRLTVLQNAQGSWNLEEVAQLLGRLGGGQSAQQTKPSDNDIPTLPNINVDDAQVLITDNQRRTATIDGLGVTGYQLGPLVWQYHATVADRLEINGKLAPGGAWAHEVDLHIQNAQPWFSPWISSWQNSAQFQAHWTGRIDSGNLLGRLDIEHADYDSVSVTGPVEFASGDAKTTLHPVGILVSTASKSFDARIDGGNILFTSGGIQSQNVGIECARGRAALDGQYNFADNSASMHVAWRDVALPSSAIQSGDFQCSYSDPLGQPRFSATLQNQGHLNEGTWNALVYLNGSGSNLKDLSLWVNARNLRFDSASGKTLDLSGLTADVGAYSDGLLLRDLSVGTNHPITGSGGYSIAKKSAWLSLDGRVWPLPGESSNILNIDLNLWENPQRIHLQQLYLSSGAVSAFIDGDYVYNLPKPINAHAWLAEKARFVSNGQTEQFRGALQSTIDLAGTLYPPDLVLTGSARGRDVHVGSRPLGNVKLDLVGYFRNNEISIGSKDVQLLGGAWTIDGQWPIHDTTFRIDNLSVKHLSLPLATANNSIGGTLDGKWSIDVRDFSPDGIIIDGSAAIHNLVIGGASSTMAQYLTFDDIQIGNMHVENSIVSVDPVSLTRKIGDHSGAADLQLYTSLDQPEQLTVALSAKAWPVIPPDGPAMSLISARTNFDLDLGTRSVAGHLELGADVLPQMSPTSAPSQGISATTNAADGVAAQNSPATRQPTTTSQPEVTPLGHFEASIDLNRRQLNVTHIGIKTLGGTATGDGFYDLDSPFTSRVALDWKNLNFAALKAFSPALTTLSGTADGSLRIAPATTPRPLEPLAINLQVQPHRIIFKNFSFGNFQASAFLGPHRFVLDNSPVHPTQIEFAFGVIRFWGRIARHDDDVYQTLLEVNLLNLELESLIPPGAKVARTPGRLSGQFTIVGRPKTPNLAFGSGTMTLSQSDLAGTGPIATLYNLMNVGHNANKPTGSGDIEFTVQQEGATITAMRYFDKGTEVRISGQIKNLSKIPACPIALIAAGSARPLSSVHIPGVADFDEALGAIQHDVISVRITGTLDHPLTKKILFGDITGDMKNLLFGDSQNGNNNNQ